MRIYGLAFVKNGVLFDYPFLESLNSLSDIVEKTFINVGISEDGTRQKVSNCENVEIIDVDWDEERSDKGHILSDMTNFPLEKMRESLKNSHSDYSDIWVIYLQSDEVLHEKDYERIKSDIEQAHKQGHDVVRFRYLHFFHDHNKIALHQRWYPQEIRAFKLDSDIFSHGDAQSFRGWTSAHESDAHIFHYGHVREQEAYHSKMSRMYRYYHGGLDLIRKRIKSKIKDFFRNEHLYPFFGDHPYVMKNRIERLGGAYIKDAVGKINILGDLSQIDSKYIESINAQEVFLNDQNLVNNDVLNVSLDLAPRMNLSKNARPWTDEFRLTIALSMCGVGLKKEVYCESTF